MWVPELVMLYNDAFQPILGESKRDALGRPGALIWSEVWDVVGPMLRGVLAGEGATWSEDERLLFDRNGFLEECYFTFSYSPIIDESGRPGGVFATVSETTERVVSERRLRPHRAGDDPGRAGELDRSTAPSSLAEPRGCSSPGSTCPATVCGSSRQQCSLRGGRPVLAAEGGAGQQRRPVPPVVTAGPARPSTPLVAVTPVPGRAAVRRTPCWSPAQSAAPSTTTTVPSSTFSPGTSARPSRTPRPSGGTATGGALAELDAAKTEFFTDVSHELRTPLTLIAGPVQESLTDRREPLPDTQRQRLELVARNAGRLRRLVDSVLDFTGSRLAG
jgi:hypothetical protein